MIQQIPLNGGLVTQVDGEEVSINACTELINAEFDKPGLIYKRKGSATGVDTNKTFVSITRWYNTNISGNYYWIGIDDADAIWHSVNLTTWNPITFTPAITVDDEVVKVVNYNTQLRFPCGLTDDTRIYQYIDRDFFWSAEGGTPEFKTDIARPRDIIADQLTGDTYVVTNHNWLKEGGTADVNLMFTGINTSTIDYYYKYSLVFDGNQEAPISAPLDDTTGGTGIVIPYLQLEFDVGASLVNWNKRITGLNIYRATSFDGIYYKVLATSTKSNDANITKVTDATKSNKVFIPSASYSTNEHAGRYFNELLPPKAGYNFDVDDITDWIEKPGDYSHQITRNTNATYASSGSNSLEIKAPATYDLNGQAWWGPLELVNGETYSISFKAKTSESSSGGILRCIPKIDTTPAEGGSTTDITGWAIDGSGSYDGIGLLDVGAVGFLSNSFQTFTASFTHGSASGTYYFKYDVLFDSGLGGVAVYIDEFFFNKQHTILSNTSDILTLSADQRNSRWASTTWSISDSAQTTFYDGGLGTTDKVYGGTDILISDSLALGSNNSHRGQLYQRGAGGQLTDERGFILNNTQKAIQVSTENGFPVNSGASGANLIICQNYLWMENGNSQRLVYVDQGVNGITHSTGDTSLDVKHRHSKYINGRNYVADVRISNRGDTEDHDNWVMFSELNQPDVIPITNYIQLTDAQGGKIVGIESLMGDLAVLMEHGIFRLSIPSADPTQWSLSESEENIGCVSENSITAWEGGLFFAGKDHLYYLDVNFKATPITASIKDDYQGLVDENARTFYDVKKNRLLCRFGADGATIYSLDLSSFPEERWTKVTSGSGDMDIFTLNENLALYSYDETTQYIKLHDDSKSESTSFKRTTGWVSQANIDKSGVLRRLNLKYNSGDRIGVKIYIDGDDSTAVNWPDGNAYHLIPSDTSGADWYKCKPSVRCRSYKIELYSADASGAYISSTNDVEIRRLEVEFE